MENTHERGDDFAPINSLALQTAYNEIKINQQWFS